jgi:hypothetical protein
MLLSDMFLFCKALKEKKSGQIRKVVYKMAHRSLIEASQFYPTDYNSQEKLKDIVQLVILSESTRDHEMGKGSETIYFKAKDTMDKDRWIEAFNPEREDDDIYQAWDCPEYVVVEDWDPPIGQTDSMPLRKGERIIVEKKGTEWMKGMVRCRMVDDVHCNIHCPLFFLWPLPVDSQIVLPLSFPTPSLQIKYPPPFPSYKTNGYFPAGKVNEMSSFHHGKSLSTSFFRRLSSRPSLR